MASNDSELKVLEAAAALSDASDRRFTLLDADGVRRVNPGLQGRFVAGLHCGLDAALEPRQCLGALRGWLEGSGRYEFLAPREVLEVAETSVVDSTGVSYRGDLVVICAGALSSGPLWRVFESDKLRRVRLQMIETEPLGRLLTTAVADGNSLRYYPAFADLAARLLGPHDPALSRLGMQLLCQQRLDGRLTLGDTHERDEPFDFDLSDESVALIE